MYRVHYESAVSITVNSETPEKAIEVADRKIRELQGFLDGSGEIVISDGDPEVEDMEMQKFQVGQRVKIATGEVGIISEVFPFFPLGRGGPCIIGIVYEPQAEGQPLGK